MVMHHLVFNNTLISSSSILVREKQYIRRDVWLKRQYLHFVNSEALFILFWCISFTLFTNPIQRHGGGSDISGLFQVHDVVDILQRHGCVSLFSSQEQ